MNRYHILSGILLPAGLMSLLIGLEQVGNAQCNEVQHDSKLCISAYADKPVKSGSGAYCEWNGNTCTEAANTLCVDRYGVGYAGKCFPQLFGTNSTYTCFKDAFQVFITVKWYEAECVQDNSECNCVWTVTSTSQQMQVCDCYDEVEED